MTDTRMQALHPLMIVNDVAETAAFYRSKLGFSFCFPEQAESQLAGDFAMMQRDNVVLMFKAVAKGTPRPNRTVHDWAPHDGFIYVRDLEPLCEELRAKGVKIVKEIGETEWGTREFLFEDNNGYVFCCGHPLARGGPG